MNTINPYLQQYKKNQVDTATPEQLLILLYDGAIQYLNKAKVAIEQQNDQQYHSNILGCEKIIMEFMNTLDMQLGGKLAENLYILYDYLYTTLVNAGVTRDITKVDEVLRHLMGLRETWQKAIEIANSEKEAKLIDDEEENGSNRSSGQYYDDGYDNKEEDDEEEDDESEEGLK